MIRLLLFIILIILIAMLIWYYTKNTIDRLVVRPLVKASYKKMLMDDSLEIDFKNNLVSTNAIAIIFDDNGNAKILSVGDIAKLCLTTGESVYLTEKIKKLSNVEYIKTFKPEEIKQL